MKKGSVIIIVLIVLLIGGVMVKFTFYPSAGTATDGQVSGAVAPDKATGATMEKTLRQMSFWDFCLASRKDNQKFAGGPERNIVSPPAATEPPSTTTGLPDASLESVEPTGAPGVTATQVNSYGLIVVNNLPGKPAEKVAAPKLTIPGAETPLAASAAPEGKTWEEMWAGLQLRDATVFRTDLPPDLSAPALEDKEKGLINLEPVVPDKHPPAESKPEPRQEKKLEIGDLKQK